MAGEMVVAPFPRRRSGTPLGPGLAPLPGPGFVVAARYQASPIGPFTELSIIEPVRRDRLRAGLAVTLSVVDDDRARRDGRANWGLPRELGTLRWDGRDGAIRLTWDERGFALEAAPSRLAFPLLVPLRLLQHRGPDPVTVPVRLRGMARMARVDLDVPEDGPLAFLAGAHRGIVVAAPRLRIAPAETTRRWAAWGDRLGRSAPIAPGLGPNG